MQYLVTKAQMKAYDRATIEETGIPSLVLMERAACSTAEEIIRRFPEGSLPEKTVLVLAGCGNNGGDGFAIGRILQEHGCRVTYRLAGKREKWFAVKSEFSIRRKKGRVSLRMTTAI